MKNSTYKNLSEILRTKVVLGVAAGLLLVSCGSQMGGYTETDGVYYDPNKDVIPEGIVMPEPNQVDEVYAYESDSASIIEQNQQNQAAQKNKYQTWNGTESDWGTYAGTEQNIYYNNYNTWGWNPYGYYSPYYGWGNGWNIGIGFGWNNWGWNPYWDPYFGYGGYGYYNPWYGYYSPYYGGYYGYNPYYYGGYYYPRNNYKRSGADAITRGNGFQNSNNRSFNNRMNTNNSNNSGFRTTPPRNTNPNMTQPPQNSNPSRFRSVPRQEPRQYEAPRQEPRRNDWGGSSNSGGGFRSGGSSSGSSSSGGGFRSGGFR